MRKIALAALLTHRAWNRDDEGNHPRTDVVHGGLAGPIVGDPPRRCGAARYSPGIDQVGIKEWGLASLVGYEVMLNVLSSGGLRPTLSICTSTEWRWMKPCA